MEKLKFKTNINCSGCIQSLAPYLEAEKSIQKWQVDPATADKILTVEGEAVEKEVVIRRVELAGFKIQF
ncbi:MAG: heavy-metal-associated domain-containing protein [Adhaeribacter sp.]